MSRIRLQLQFVHLEGLACVGDGGGGVEIHLQAKTLTMKEKSS